MRRSIKISAIVSAVVISSAGVFSLGYWQGYEASFGQAALTQGMFTVTALDFLRAGETESTQANLELTLDMYVLARANYEDNPLLVSKYFEKTTYEPGFYNMPLRSVRNYRKKYPPRIQDKESLKKIFRVLNEKK